MADYKEYATEEQAVLDAQLQVEQAEEAMDDFLLYEVDEFKKQSIRTKEELKNSIELTISAYQKEASEEKKNHVDAFYDTLMELLREFYRKVTVTDFPEPLPDWWFYSYQIRVTGIQLFLNYLSWEAREVDCFECYSNIFSSLAFLDIPARLMPLSEYAEEYGVEAVTVRQWIRRGKIRSAVKFGSEWRIPELVELQKSTHYVPVEYCWGNDLQDVPERFAYLSKMRGVSIYQDSGNRRKFTILPYDDEHRWYFPDEPDEIEERKLFFAQYPELTLNDEACIVLEPKEREELEVYLIANPAVSIRSKSRGNGYSVYPEIGLIAEYGTDYAGGGYTVSLGE